MSGNPKRRGKRKKSNEELEGDEEVSSSVSESATQREASTAARSSEAKSSGDAEDETMTAEEQEMLQERRAYNRANSARARQRTKEQISTLVYTIEQQATRINELTEQVRVVTEENARLQHTIQGLSGGGRAAGAGGALLSSSSQQLLGNIITTPSIQGPPIGVAQTRGHEDMSSLGLTGLSEENRIRHLLGLYRGDVQQLGASSLISPHQVIQQAVAASMNPASSSLQSHSGLFSSNAPSLSHTLMTAGLPMAQDAASSSHQQAAFLNSLLSGSNFSTAGIPGGGSIAAATGLSLPDQLRQPSSTSLQQRQTEALERALQLHQQQQQLNRSRNSGSAPGSDLDRSRSK